MVQSGPTAHTAGKLTVEKATLTVRADNKGRAYGEPNPAFTATVSGLVNSDSEAIALPTKPTLATAATSSSATGTYPITLTGGAPSTNDTLVRHDGTLTVAERAITVTAAPQTKTYGTADPTLTHGVPRAAWPTTTR